MKKKIIYPAIFNQDEDGITITFPDLPGCISCADSFEEAFEMAKEAMALYLEDYVTDLFKSAPKPSEINKITLQTNECIALIDLDVKLFLRSLDQKSVKKTLTIPSWMNEVGLTRNINFSKILQEGIIKYLDENEL